MGSKAVLGSVAGLAVLALVWLMLAQERGGSGRGRDPAEAEEARPALVESAREVARESVERAHVREPAPGAVPTERALAQSPPPPANPLFAVLSGRVVDGAAAPIAGAEVVVRRPEAGHFTMLDLETRHAPKEHARAVTDAGGSFSFELERGIPFDVAVSADGFCDELVTQRYAGEELEVALRSGFLVYGFVRRTHDVAPVADARVRVFQLGNSARGDVETTTAGDGSYRLRITYKDNARLEVLPLREQSSDWIALEFDAEDTARQDVLLADGIDVRGRVVEAGSKKPIAGALVGEGWTFRRFATTDARGEYVLPGFGNTGEELYAKAQGYGKVQRANLPPAVDGVLRVDFELPRGRLVRGRVLDPDGRPLPDAYVAAVASEDHEEGQRTDWISGRTDFAGRFELGGLTPELRHCLMASAEGFGTVVHDFPSSELEETELDLGDVRLAPAAVLAGVVRDETGAAWSNVEVLLTGTNRDRGSWRGESALPPAGDWYVDSRRATTDARGRFWFGALPAGDFQLRARGQPSSRRAEIRLEDGEMRDGVVLLYPRGETIRGIVVDTEDHPLAGVYLNARLTAPRAGWQALQVRAGEDDRTYATMNTGPDGLFELRGLPPGKYHLRADPFELASDPDFPWLSTELDVESAAPESAEPLRLVLPRGHSIRGRLVDKSGAALVGYVVVGQSSTGSASPAGTTSEDGSFTLEVLPGTVWDLEVHGAWQTAAWDTIFHTELGIAAGTRELVLRVDLGGSKSQR